MILMLYFLIVFSETSKAKKKKQKRGVNAEKHLKFA
jgi:hypothetical protein